MAGSLIMLMRLVAIIWIAIGTLLIFAPEILRKKLFAKLKNAPLKKLSAIPIVIGVLLLLAAQYNEYSLVVILLGLLAIIKGIYGIVATEKMEKIQDWWISAKKKVYRICGIIIIILGFIVLSGI